MFKPRTLADAVDKVARQSAGRDWGLYASLLGHWVEIVGAEYANVSTPVKIAFPYQPHVSQRKNGVLTVRLPKGLAMEFSFKAELIRQRVNMFFGYEAFAKIALDAASIPPPVVRKVKKLAPEQVEAIKEKASLVTDPEVRKALEEFGEALMSRDDASTN